MPPNGLSHEHSDAVILQQVAANNARKHIRDPFTEQIETCEPTPVGYLDQVLLDGEIA